MSDKHVRELADKILDCIHDYSYRIDNDEEKIQVTLNALINLVGVVSHTILRKDQRSEFIETIVNKIIEIYELYDGLK